MIDKINGHIRLNDSLYLEPNSSFKIIERQKLGELQEIRDMGNGYKWLDIKNIQIDNQYFIMSLCFLKEKLSQITMVTNDKPFDLNSGWDSWSEKAGKEKLKKFEKWLNKELAKERKFNWGEVWTDYDPRRGSSSIGIKYK
tara:strand:- start:159 stop:581 length:423 start_codon:yes stop_codon:yes gene_type:complete